jgi:hypothetical protein
VQVDEATAPREPAPPKPQATAGSIPLEPTDTNTGDER